jgi:outer membrane protein TolC
MLKYKIAVLPVFFLLPFLVPAQNKTVTYFIDEALKNNPSLTENTNLQQFFQIQNEIITAQNKKPQVNFTADYIFAPFFFNNGRVIAITPNPSPKAIGYDAALSNGGLYAGQFNVSIPIFNKALIKPLYEQNKIQSDISAFSRRQLEEDLKKSIIDQYIITYQFKQQTDYLQKIIDQLESRKPFVTALVKQGLLQQNDYLLLDIQQTTSRNDLLQLQFAYINGVGLLKSIAAIADTTVFDLTPPEITLQPVPAEYYYAQKFRLDSMNLVAQRNVFNMKYKTQVSAMGSTGIYSSDISNLPRNTGLSAGVHLLVPIYDGKQRKLNERQSSVLLTNLQAYRNNASVVQKNNLHNAKQQIIQWQQTITLLDQQIQKQELLLDIIKDKVVRGQVSVMDYINALQDYAVTQKNKALATTNVLLYTNQYNYYNW